MRGLFSRDARSASFRMRWRKAASWLLFEPDHFECYLLFQQAVLCKKYVSHSAATHFC